MLEIIGKVSPPPGVRDYIGQGQAGAAAFGLIGFVSSLVKLLIVIAGLYAFINLILAGFAFMSAGGDPKAVEKAWGKIWQSIIGLVIIASSFLIIALVGWILFKDPGFILRPRIVGPQ